MTWLDFWEYWRRVDRFIWTLRLVLVMQELWEFNWAFKVARLIDLFIVYLEKRTSNVALPVWIWNLFWGIFCRKRLLFLYPILFRNKANHFFNSNFFFCFTLFYFRKCITTTTDFLKAFILFLQWKLVNLDRKLCQCHSTSFVNTRLFNCTNLLLFTSYP